jgi:hypothetical protein
MASLNVIQDVPGMEALLKGYLLGSRFLGAEAPGYAGHPLGEASIPPESELLNYQLEMASSVPAAFCQYNCEPHLLQKYQPANTSMACCLVISASHPAHSLGTHRLLVSHAAQCNH